MMAQHGRLVAFLSLGLFSLIGLAVAILWRKHTFRIRPAVLTLGVLLWLSGILLVSWQLRELRKYAAIEEWPSVTGVVLSAQVIGERAFRPNIVYQYVVGQQTFKDSTDLDQPGFGGRNNKRNAAETIVAAYPVGRELPVHYDPSHPEISLLRVSPDWSIYGKIGFGAFLFGIGIFLATAYFIKRT
jgi:hypothetical protein